MPTLALFGRGGQALQRAARNWAFRIVAIYAGLFALSVLAVLGFVYATTLSLIDVQINATILADINGLSDRYRDDGLDGLLDAIGNRLANDRSGDSIYIVIDSDGKSRGGNLLHWPNKPGREGRWLNFTVATDDTDPPVDNVTSVRGISFPLSDGGKVLVARDLAERVRFENTIVQALFWSLAVTAGLAVLGGIVMSQDMRKRIETINRTTQQIVRGDLQRRIPLRGTNDDFDQLSRNLNGMLDRINRLMNAMREVSDNVAHDLRSPLTRLKSRLELSLIGHDEPEQLRQSIQTAVVETDNLLATFNALLSIAQAETGTFRGETTPIDLGTLCSDVAALYEPLAEAKDLTYMVKIESGGRLIGNRHLLFQALANLLDNAIKYTPAGGAVSMDVSRSDRRAEIIIADTGPGIPLEERQRVLERFVRLESSRTTPGNGLGLSLVTAVIGLHQGTLSLEDNYPGLRVVLNLPVEADVAGNTSVTLTTNRA